MRYVPAVAGSPLVETLEAKRIRSGAWALESPSTFSPLTIGDLVTISHHELPGSPIIGIVGLQSVWVWEVSFYLPKGIAFGEMLPEDHPVLDTINYEMGRWRTNGFVTPNTTFTCLVTTRKQMSVEIAMSKYAEHIELRRTPDLKPDLDHWLANPDLG